MSKQNHHCDSVAIFWDIENCPAPARGIFSTGHALVKRMREKTCHFGQIKHIRAYADMSMLRKELRGQLQSSGVHLIEVPHRRKDAADKMIIADLCLFAVDNQPPATIILITGDRDFAYSIAQLSQRGYFIGLVIPSQGAPDELRAQANVIIEWRSGNVVFPDEWTMTEYSVSDKGNGLMKTEPVYYNPLTYTFRRKSSVQRAPIEDSEVKSSGISPVAAGGGEATPSTISEASEPGVSWEKLRVGQDAEEIGNSDDSGSSTSEYAEYNELEEAYDKVRDTLSGPSSQRNSIARRRSSSIIGEFSRFAPLLDVVQSCVMEGIETSSGSSRGQEDEAELNDIAQKLRKTMPHWLDDLEVNRYAFFFFMLRCFFVNKPYP